MFKTEKVKNHKLSTRLGKSLLQNQPAMINSNQMPSNNTQQLLTESNPSLLQRVSMGPTSLDPCMSDELGSLVKEVKDMQSLVGVIPTSPEQTTSTISLPNYPRVLSLGLSRMSSLKGVGHWEEMTVDKNPMMILKNEGGQTKSSGSMNPKCLGTMLNSESENQVRTSAVIKPEISSRLSNETQPLSKDGSDVH